MRDSTESEIILLEDNVPPEASTSNDRNEDGLDAAELNSAKNVSKDDQDRCRPVPSSSGSSDSNDELVLPKEWQTPTRRNRSRKKATEKSKKGTEKPRLQLIKSGKEKSTQEALRAERERLKRLAERQKEFNGIEVVAEENDSTGEVQLAYQNPSQKRRIRRLDLDPGIKERFPLVQVDERFLSLLKQHQAEGIQFLYESTIESIERLVDHNDPGGGGILAHCMGLGKTLQVIVFLYTIMTHETLKKYINRVLIIVPKNVILNWQSEFKKWLRDVDPALDTLAIFELGTRKTPDDRLAVCEQWYNSYVNNKGPSVLIIGYEMYVNLVASQQEREEARQKANRQNKSVQKTVPIVEKKLEKLRPQFLQYLQEGPHLLICDEGHRLKNDQTLISITMRKIRTIRRIFLTGTPMQNNLKEYHCMINYIKPGLLGDAKEFQSLFSNVIERGRSKDATPLEVKYMQRRCHVLYTRLDRVLHRRDFQHLVSVIPEKKEYVIFVRLTKPQIELYQSFLDTCCATLDLASRRRRLLTDGHIFARIYNHPYLLYERELQEQRKILREEAEDDPSFIVSDSDDDDEGRNETETDSKNNKDELKGDADNNPSNSKYIEIKRKDQKTQSKAEVSTDELDKEDPDRCDTPIDMVGWYRSTGLVSPEDKDRFELSNKIVLLIQIIKHCERIGDKLLVFSRSIECLSLIERMLKTLAQSGNWFGAEQETLDADEEWSWIKDLDYFVITGATSGQKRAWIQDHFNNASDLRARLMLISTRAGSLGTNLIGANRVVIFDCSWNPSHDTQSLFRVYRFGQNKPVYIYRFVAQGTIEQTIYNRDVTKESIAHRVIDQEIAIDRHFTEAELQEYYKFYPDESISVEPEQNISRQSFMAKFTLQFHDKVQVSRQSSQGKVSRQSPSQREEQVRPSGCTMRFVPPKDILLGKVLLSHGNCVVDYKRHDSLFDEIDEDKLTDAERQEAWSEFQRELREEQKKLSKPI